MTTPNSSEPTAWRLILGTSSPRRVALFRQTGWPFSLAVSEVEEISTPGMDPAELARQNARRKADAVAARHPGCLVIGADTVVALGERIFGKPSDLAEARAMLSALAGQTHEVLTAVCLRRVAGHDGVDFLEEFVERALVTFHSLAPDAITRYLERVSVLDKAGGYALQEDEGDLIAHVEGDSNTVIGLPVAALDHALRRIFSSTPVTIPPDPLS